MKNLNLNVDAVLCISLRERSDRRQAVLKEASKLGLNVEFVIVERDNEDPQRGCFNSHKKCAQLSLERGYRRVLVLEDDVVFENNALKKVDAINRFLNNKDPEVFYLGAILGKIWLTWHWGIARVRGQGAHAIILTSRACKKISCLEYTGYGIDNLYTKMFKIYTCFPMIAYQQPAELFPSDLDSFRKHEGKGEKFWRNIRKKQYVSVLQNIFKTLAGR